MTGRTTPTLGESLANPKDILRWAFWGPFRDWLDPRRPQQLRALWPLWPLLYRAAGSQKRRMSDEYHRIFGDRLSSAGYLCLIREAYRVAFRAHLEELLMGRLDPITMPGFLRLHGRANLEKALERGRGAIILSAHAGSFMLPIAALSLLGYPYTQYAARGMPPQQVAREHADAVPTSWWAARARQAREENEDRLPARFITLKTPTRELFRRLAANELVALAFDGRIGNRWVRAPFLNRQALLNPGAYRLSASTGAAIIPTLCRTPAGTTSICALGSPIFPRGRSWRQIMAEFLERHAEPWLLAHPEEYGTWLAHCRLRNRIDDHPLFVDHAEDDRWKRHPSLYP